MMLTDFCILTPLHEEWRAVKGIIVPTDYKEVEEGEGGMVYYLWTHGKAPTHLFVGAAHDRMGNTNAASITSAAIHHWNPAYIVLLGIAGGLKPKKQKVGDVVVAEEILGYVVDEISDEGEQSKRRFRTTGQRADAMLVRQVKALVSNDIEYKAWQNNCIQAAEGSIAEKIERPPEIHIGITATGNTVVKSTKFSRELLERLNQKMIAVAMEMDGVFDAVWGSSTKAEVLMIRGISDFADPEKQRHDAEGDGAWRKWAAGNAARLLSALLSRRSVQQIESVISPFELNVVRDTRRDIVIDDKVYLSGEGDLSFSFNPLFKMSSGTPRIKISVHGVTQTGDVVLPTKARCIVCYDDGREFSYPINIENGSVNLPKTMEPIQVRLSLGFSAEVNPPDHVEVILEDEFGRAITASSPS